MYIHFNYVNATLKLLIIFEPMVANVKTVSEKSIKMSPIYFHCYQGRVFGIG